MTDTLEAEAMEQQIKATLVETLADQTVHGLAVAVEQAAWVEHRTVDTVFRRQ